MTTQRAYVSGNFGLELDGKPSGWLISAEGGMPTTEVVTEKLGPDHLLHKHISGLKYEDVTLTFGTGMSSGFWNWIQSSFDRNYLRKNGAIVAADYNFKETSRLSFFESVVNELTFPGLDASSKDNCKVTCKLTPEYTKWKLTPKGSKPDFVSGDKMQARQHRWSPANFRLNIDGCDCSRIFKIEPLTLRQKLTDYAVGEERDVQKEPAQVEYPNLVITMPESHSHAFFDWYEDFVIKGNCAEGKERTGTLEYLNYSLDKTLFTLNFHGLGIYKVTPDKSEAGAEQIRRVKFEMYSEKIDFKFSSEAVFG
jgi:phage tail-like protein